MATRAIGKLVGSGRSLAAAAACRSAMPRQYSGGLFTPDYLETGKSSIPLYATLNIQIKSYDYPVLENYQKFVDVLADNLDMTVEDSWALPPTCLQVQRFKPNSSVIVSTYEIKEYERNVQMNEVSAIQYPILLRALEASIPEGVTLKVEYFNPLYEKKRYVPDKELLTLKDELTTISNK